MAQAKRVAKPTPEPRTPEDLEPVDYEPMLTSEDREDSQRLGSADPAKVNTRLPFGPGGYIPGEQQPGSGNVPEDVKKKAKQTEGEIVRRRSPSRQPGYVTKSRVDTVALTAHVPKELRTAVNKAANKAGVTTQDFLVAVLSHAAAQQQLGRKPVKVDVAEAIEKYQEAQRNAVREAVLRLAENLT